jgi:uncharacterized protein
MANNHGDFIWYELMTDNAAAAEEFYAKVVGWDAYDPNHPGMEYHILKMPTGEIAGVMPLTAEMKGNGARPCWMGYVAVDDVDVSAKAVEAAGGSIHVQPTDIPEVGRFAFVADPQGAMFYIMKSLDPTSNAFAETEPMAGHCAWNELATSDPDGAKAFYGGLFGWSKEGEMDMGPLGKYEFLKVKSGRFAIGAVMPRMPEMPVSAWSFYFRVPDIDAAVATIGAKGGAILQAPTEIPGGEYSVNAMDPQGAAFGLVGPRKE